MRDFDKLRSGFITQNQLRIGFNMAKIQLSNTEFKLLNEGFDAEAKPGHVKWRELVDAIDTVFTVKGLEKNNTIQPTGARTQANYGKASVEKNEKSLVE